MNGTLILLPKCNVVPCDSPVSNHGPDNNSTVHKLAIQDLTVDAAFDSDPSARMDTYLTQTNIWAFGEWSDNPPRVGAMFRVPRGGRPPWEQIPRVGFTLPPRDFFEIDYIIQPFLIREFAVMHQTDVFGRSPEMQHLARAMDRNEQDTHPDPRLVAFVQSQDNLMGFDVATARARREELANPSGYDYERAGLPEVARYDIVEQHSYFRMMWEHAASRIAVILAEIYPGDQIARLAGNLLRDQWMTCVRGLRGGRFQRRGEYIRRA